MARLIQTIIVLAALLTSERVLCFPDRWENFDAGEFDSLRDETLGNTQVLLDQREGRVECIVCHEETNDHYKGVIGVDDIIAQTMGTALACLNWEVRGVCIWLTCFGPACDIETSIKVKNHVPDLVIQAYDRANGEPWAESQTLNQVSQGDADSTWVTTIIGLIEDIDLKGVRIRGGVSTEGARSQRKNLHFKLVDAYGNPAIIPFNALAKSTGYTCEGTATPFFPYYISNLDSVAWRWDVPEMFYPQSWAGFGQYDLGSIANNYGPIYPRHGFMTAHDPLKASVLATYRAAHFITRSGEPHLYFSIDENDRDGYWPPDPLKEHDRDTGQFQMLYPDRESGCRSFPYSGNPPVSKRSTDGSYVWNFWRAYKCCERRGAILIFHAG